MYLNKTCVPSSCAFLKIGFTPTFVPSHKPEWRIAGQSGSKSQAHFPGISVAAANLKAVDGGKGGRD